VRAERRSLGGDKRWFLARPKSRPRPHRGVGIKQRLLSFVFPQTRPSRHSPSPALCFPLMQRLKHLNCLTFSSSCSYSAMYVTLENITYYHPPLSLPPPASVPT
ncbi:hypothetical protein T310_6316, partial [Rasamsonia emersonii CBS 393.64]